MIKIEIKKGDFEYSKVYQNSLSDDWIKALMERPRFREYELTKNDIKIYYVPTSNKEDMVGKIDCSTKGKVKVGRKIQKPIVSGDKVSKKFYDDFYEKIKNADGAKDFKKASHVAQHKDEAEMYSLKDDEMFNKEWFITEREFTCVELRWPYDDDMNFIGFDYDPEA